MDSRLSHPKDSSRYRGGVLLAVAVLVGLLVGLWIGRASAPERGDDHPSESAPDSSSTERRIVNGVPVGYERNESGAVEAATNFTRAMASVTDDAEAYREALKTMAAPQWIRQAEEVADNGLEFLRERYGLGGSFTFSPVRYAVVDYSTTASTIQLWGVTVASGPRVQGIEESWLTATIDLVWVSGDWRVSGQQSTTGPTPELLQPEDATTESSLDGFEEYRYAPAP